MDTPPPPPPGCVNAPPSTPHAHKPQAACPHLLARTWHSSHPSPLKKHTRPAPGTLANPLAPPTVRPASRPPSPISPNRPRPRHHPRTQTNRVSALRPLLKPAPASAPTLPPAPAPPVLPSPTNQPKELTQQRRAAGGAVLGLRPSLHCIQRCTVGGVVLGLRPSLRCTQRCIGSGIEGGC